MGEAVGLDKGVDWGGAMLDRAFLFMSWKGVAGRGKAEESGERRRMRTRRERIAF